MKTVFLSHSLGEKTPGFGGHAVFWRESKKSLANGDSCNQQIWKLDNHGGTHLDVPLHFYESGFSVDQVSADDWVFARIGLLSLSVEANQILNAKDLNLDSLAEDIDLLLIQTGFESKRSQIEYWQSNPGLAADLAEDLTSRFANLRAIGFDFISLTAFQNRSVGRVAHQKFLSPEKPLVIIEDMKLSPLTGAPRQVVVAPLRVELADGAPCTVFALV